jgi:large subunit ribosomal protein L30
VASKKLKLTLVRSIIGLSPKQEGTVKALGLRHINQTVVHDDTETIRGMVFAVQHMLKVDHEA